MTDLIDRQAAIDALAKFVPYVIDDVSTESYANGLTDAYNLICQLPSVQPEIIRCKDCIHFKYFEDQFVQMTRCDVHDRCPDYTDYCSWAERKEE